MQKISRTTMLIPNLTILVFFLVMNTSDMTEVKENLTVGGSITLPIPNSQNVALYLNNSIIALVNNRVFTIIDEDFREKLENKVSGQFTITGLQRKNSGIYRVEDTPTKESTSYHLTVYDPAPMPDVKVSAWSSESCSLVCFVEKVDETVLYWYKGEKILNQNSTVPSLPLTVDKEALNSSYSCVAANPANNNTLSLNITALCSDNNLIIITSDDSRTGYWWLCLVVLAVIALLVMMIIMKRKMDSHRTRQGIISTSRDSTKREETIYTEVTVKRTNRQERNSLELSEISPVSNNLTTVSPQSHHNLTTIYDTVRLNRTDAAVC